METIILIPLSNAPAPFPDGTINRTSLFLLPSRVVLNFFLSVERAHLIISKKCESLYASSSQLSGKRCALMNALLSRPQNLLSHENELLPAALSCSRKAIADISPMYTSPSQYSFPPPPVKPKSPPVPSQAHYKPHSNSTPPN